MTVYTVTEIKRTRTIYEVVAEDKTHAELKILSGEGRETHPEETTDRVFEITKE